MTSEQEFLDFARWLVQLAQSPMSIRAMEDHARRAAKCHPGNREDLILAIDAEADRARRLEVTAR